MFGFICVVKVVTALQAMTLADLQDSYKKFISDKESRCRVTIMICADDHRDELSVDMNASDYGIACIQDDAFAVLRAAKSSNTLSV